MSLFDASDTVLAMASPTPRQRIAALIIIVLSAVTLAAAAPFATLRVGELQAFLPAYQSALMLIDLVTAVLLLSQLAAQRTLALLVLASGYLFDSLVIALHTLSFPGLFTATGLMGAGPQTTAWIYMFWHGGFAVFVLAYALLSRRGPGPAIRFPGRAIALASAAVVVLVAAIGLATTVGHDWLPVIMRGSDYSLSIQKGISPSLLVLSLLAIVALFPRRRRSALDLWLIVVMVAWVADVTLSGVVGSHRYDLGWYAGRAYGLLAAAALLVILLIETHALQVRLERSRAALLQAQQLETLGQLTGGVAHDFNNLLAVLDGALQSIRSDVDNPARVDHWVEVGLGATTQGARLVQQLLTFARRQVSRPQTVNLNKRLSDLEPLLVQAIGGRAELGLALSPVLEPVRLDPAQFEAAILNLVINARDAMSPGGRIEVVTENVDLASGFDELAPGPHVLVSVRDTGTGMAPDVVAKAIHPFFTTKPAGTGTGLGLSQVFGFVKSFGGSLRIESVVGRGTTILLYFPKAAQPLETASDDRLPLRTATPDGQTVLVVEDEPALLEVAAEGLRKLGYTVVAASGAAAALEVLRGGQPVDILFSDTVMPGGMNGVQLAVEARRLRPVLKVLLTSGYPRGSGVGAEIPDDMPLLTKPYRREQLAAQLRIVDGSAAG